MLEEAGLIKDASASQWQKIDAQSAAKMLASTSESSSTRMKLVGRIARGDSSAASQVLAKFELDDQLHEQLRKLDGKTLQDPTFKHDLKSVLLRALHDSSAPEAKLATSGENATIKELAALVLHTAHASAASPIVEQAEQLAARIGHGDLIASKELVAQRAVLRKIDRTAQASAFEQTMKNMSKLTMKNPKFGEKVKHLLRRALRASGVHISKAESKGTPQQMAQWLAQVRTSKNQIDDPVVSAALMLAPSIAHDGQDAARKLVALEHMAKSQLAKEVSKLKGSSLESATFNGATKAALLKTLVQTGIIKTASSSSWKHLNAQDAAKLLLSAHLNQHDATTPAAAVAIRLASKIAAGNAKAAQQLVAQDRAAKDQKRLVQSELEPESEPKEHRRGMFNATVAIYRHVSEKKPGSKVFPASVSIFPEGRTDGGMHDEEARVVKHGGLYEIRNKEGKITAVVHPNT